MVGAKSVFVVSVVDGNLDRYGSVYQTNDSGRDTNKIGIPAIGRTSEPVIRRGQRLPGSGFNILGD